MISDPNLAHHDELQQLFDQANRALAAVVEQYRVLSKELDEHRLRLTALRSLAENPAVDISKCPDFIKNCTTFRAVRKALLKSQGGCGCGRGCKHG